MNNFEDMTREERLNTPVPQMGRVDIRGYIRRRLTEEGISQYRLAKILGIPRTNLATALRGEIPMPLERMETILWILDGENSPFRP